MQRWFFFLLKASISVALIAFLINRTDLGGVAGRLVDISKTGAAATIVLLLIQVATGTLRWTIVVGKLYGPVKYLTALKILLVGNFFNQTLPSSIGGDAVRVWQTHRIGIPLSTAFHSVFLDRVSAAGALLLMVLASAPILVNLMGDAPTVWAIPLMLAGGATAFAILFNLHRLPGFMSSWLPAKLMENLSTDARKVFLSRDATPRVLALSVINHALGATTVYVLARDLDIAISLLHCLVLVPLVVLITTLPISLAGWGVREGAMVVALSLVGVTTGNAFALSVLFGLCILVVGLPGGVIWLFRIRAMPPGDATIPDEAERGCSTR